MRDELEWIKKYSGTEVPLRRQPIVKYTCFRYVTQFSPRQKHVLVMGNTSPKTPKLIFQFLYWAYIRWIL